MLGLLLGIGIGLKLSKKEEWARSWSNWDDVPEHVKDEFRESMADMRDSMNDMFDRFEEDFE